MSGRIEVADAEIVHAEPGQMLMAEAGAVEYRWQGFAWKQSFEPFRTGGRSVHLLETTAV